GFENQACVESFHQVGAAHRTDVSHKITGRAVSIQLPRLKFWLFADHTIALNFSFITIGVRNKPLPAQQLNRKLIGVFNCNVVGEIILLIFSCRELFFEMCLYTDFNSTADCCYHGASFFCYVLAWSLVGESISVC